MIIYANGKVLGTDKEGNTSEIAAVGPNAEYLLTHDDQSFDALKMMIIELRRMNMHLETITDQKILDSEVNNLPI